MTSYNFYYNINKNHNNINIDFCLLYDTDEYIAKYEFNDNHDLIANLKILLQKTDFGIFFHHDNELIFGLEYKNYINDIILNAIADLENISI